ncbi:MAG TPA: glutamine--fructose-6-phosphate transaminase (isomerizing), partial [Bdellovibrionota bacterium]|nr:glutamine--fructose-6-phosphate transaminase (isomerizing) [Bdellovibrionota bacterium]
MCGIVGYIGPRDPEAVLLDGLHHLEYRGYDSAGVAIFDQGKVEVIRAVGKLSELEKELEGRKFTGPIGIGHTRWATHGRPTLENAHPQHSGNVSIVHNGIIENYLELKEGLVSNGHKFVSETDTEVVSHLIDRELKSAPNRPEAIRRAVTKLKGAFALGVIFDDDTSHLYAVRNGAPLIVGVGDRETFIASDIPAVLNYTNKVIPLNDEEIAICTTDSCSILNFQNGKVHRPPEVIEWSSDMVEKGGYPHFMLKEIHEQPRAILETIDEYIDKSNFLPIFPDLEKLNDQLKTIDRVEMIACGTSYYAGLVAEYYFEEFAKLPTEVGLASEYRYRHPSANSKTLMITISQSGETADTLAGLKMAKELGAITIALSNVRGGSIPREAKATIYTQAGLEIGV